MGRQQEINERLQKKIRNTQTPASIEEFLNEKVITSSQTNMNPLAEVKIQEIKREEFKFPLDLSEKLRLASFSLNKKKTDIVQEALIEYLVKIGI
jgi:hypothetical protein